MSVLAYPFVLIYNMISYIYNLITAVPFKKLASAIGLLAAIIALFVVVMLLSYGSASHKMSLFGPISDPGSKTTTTANIRPNSFAFNLSFPQPTGLRNLARRSTLAERFVAGSSQSPPLLRPGATRDARVDLTKANFNPLRQSARLRNFAHRSNVSERLVAGLSHSPPRPRPGATRDSRVDLTEVNFNPLRC